MKKYPLENKPAILAFFLVAAILLLPCSSSFAQDDKDVELKMMYRTIKLMQKKLDQLEKRAVNAEQQAKKAQENAEAATKMAQEATRALNQYYRAVKSQPLTYQQSKALGIAGVEEETLQEQSLREKAGQDQQAADQLNKEADDYQLQASEANRTSVDYNLGDVAIRAHQAALRAEKKAEQARQEALKAQKQADSASTLAGTTKNLAKGFDFHGYLRSGYGVNSNGGQIQAMQAPGAESKYRLGNEAETYGELILSKEWLDAEKKEDGPHFTTAVLVAFKTFQDKDWNPGSDELMIREAYAELGNLDFAPGITFWAGERFYFRHDIYPIDFYYLDMSGYGGGAYDINMWDHGKLALAYLGGSEDKIILENSGKISKNTFDIRYYDVHLLNGELIFWLAPSFLPGGTTDNGTKVDSNFGMAFGLLHQQDDFFGLTDGMNHFSIQYGFGSAYNFTPNVPDLQEDMDQRWRFRVTESALVQLGDFSFMPVFVYQLDKQGQGSDMMKTWISAGIRPQYNITENFALQASIGMDYVRDEVEDFDGVLGTFSFAPTLTVDNLYFTRPVIRAYVTYGMWDNGFKGLVGGEAFHDQTHGLNTGIQMEAWW